MATRTSSSSLRRRLAWTLGAAAMIGVISLALILVFHSSHRNFAEVKLDAPATVAVETSATAILTNASNDGRPSTELHFQPAAHDADSGNGANHDSADASTSDSPRHAKPAGDFHSARYGYNVNLRGTPWTQWESLPEVVPEAEWGALLGERGRFLVIPVSLAGLDPHPEALDHALLARLGMAYPSQQLAEFKSIEIGSAVGHVFQFSREVGGVTNVYCVWVLRRDSFAYLAAAWMEQSPAKGASIVPNPAELNAALRRLQFDNDFRAEIDATTLNSIERQTHSTVFNELGLFAFNNRDYASAVESFRRAFELVPNDAVILQNLLNSHVELKQYTEALAVLEPCLKRFANQPELWACRAFLLSELGNTNAALAAYEALFASDYDAEGPFTRFVNLLATNDRADEALVAVERFLARHDSLAVRRLKAALYRQLRKPEQAITILGQLHDTRPYSAEVAYDLADALQAVERYQDSLEVCRELIEHRYDTAHTFLLQGRSEFALKWYAAARTSLQAALKREPANKEAAELLAVVGTTLGEGNTAGIREEIEAVAWPAALLARGAADLKNTDEAEFHEFGAYYLSRRVALEFRAAKSFKLTDRRAIRILDPSGLARFSTIQIPFDPASEQIFVNSLRVLDAQNQEVASGKPADFYVLDRPVADAVNQSKLLNIPVPGLQVGRTIELTVTRRRFVPPEMFPYTMHVFSSDAPVVFSALCVLCDNRAIQFQASQDLRLTKLDDGMAWSIARPAIYRDEPLQQSRLDFLPHVTVASTTSTWQGLAADYLKSIADRLEPDESIAQLAQQITAGLNSKDERTVALAQYVQSHLTYKAIEFGSHSRLPHHAAAVVANKYGDCKDHALLLVQLMRSRGLAANLALANLDDPVDPRTPGLEQFNHVLVFAPDYRGGRLIDCTDKNSDIANTESPLDLGGAKVLVLDGAEARLLDIPSFGDHSSRMEVSRVVRLTEQTDAAVDETVTVTGYQAAMLRATFKEVPPADRAATLQGEIAPPGSALQVKSLEIENLDQTDRPLVFKAKCVVRNCFRAAGLAQVTANKSETDSLLGHMPLVWERAYLDVPSVPNRRTPFVIAYPLDFSSTIEFITPAGYEIEQPPATDIHSDTAFITWNLHAEPAEHGIRLQYQLHEPAAKYAASQYADYDNALDRAVTAISQSIVLKRTN